MIGVRDNQLSGYGVVTGLNGTGDDISVPFAAQSLLALMRRLGVQVDSGQMRLRNVAAVMVTATSPLLPSGGPPRRHDLVDRQRAVTARGVLLQSPFTAPTCTSTRWPRGLWCSAGTKLTGQSGSSVRTNSTTAARIPSGALVERENPDELQQRRRHTLALRQGDLSPRSASSRR